MSWSVCELLRAQKYAVRGQCDNTDVWTVPHDGSSGIILSVTEKEGAGRLWFGKELTCKIEVEKAKQIRQRPQCR